jgi:four helix bundle protein
MSDECEVMSEEPRQTPGERRKGGQLAERTKGFALAMVRLYSGLPRTTVAQILGKQALRSGTSVGAQYREGTRARSPAEFVSKVEAALQELEETCYWLELLSAARAGSPDRLGALLMEARELTAMLVSSARTAKARRARRTG